MLGLGQNGRMTDDTTDTQLGRLLQLSGHELRSPLGAVSGYIRMVLKGQVGPITESQERILKEAERSCGRLKNVLDEMSLLARMERGEEGVKRTEFDLGELLEEAIADLPESTDRVVVVELRRNGAVRLTADPARIKLALSSVLFALRRELVDTDRLVVTIGRKDRDARIAIGAADQVDTLASAPADALAPFDDFRGGCGLRLPIARRIIEQHKGGIYGAGPSSRASAVLRLPLT